MKLTKEQETTARLFNLTDIRKIKRLERKHKLAEIKFIKTLQK